MKIAIICTAYPYRGGLAAFNERMAREFLISGHDVEVITFTLQYPGFLFPGKSQYSEESAPDGIRIKRLISSVNPFNWVSVGNKLFKEQYDLVIIKYWLPFMGPAFGTILRNLKKNPKTKVVCIIDNIIPHESRPGDNIFTRYFIKPVDAFVAMSHSVLNDLTLFDSVKPRLYAPHPIFDNFGSKEPRGDALTRLGLSTDYRYMMFFGFVRPYKGLDLLLEAVSDSRFRSTDIKLIIAGEYYSDSAKYKELISLHNLENDIYQFDKFIADSEVATYFNACDLVVQPYKSATQSGVTQIAYHFDKPMIVTDVGGLSEMCPDGKVGYVVAPVAQSIGDAILKFFYETDLEALAGTILEEKKKYSWALLVKSIESLYEKVNFPKDSNQV